MKRLFASGLLALLIGLTFSAASLANAPVDSLTSRTTTVTETQSSVLFQGSVDTVSTHTWFTQALLVAEADSLIISGLQSDSAASSEDVDVYLEVMINGTWYRESTAAMTAIDSTRSFAKYSSAAVEGVNYIRLAIVGQSGNPHTTFYWSVKYWKREKTPAELCRFNNCAVNL